MKAQEGPSPPPVAAKRWQLPKTNTHTCGTCGTAAVKCCPARCRPAGRRGCQSSPLPLPSAACSQAPWLLPGNHASDCCSPHEWEGWTLVQHLVAHAAGAVALGWGRERLGRSLSQYVFLPPCDARSVACKCEAQSPVYRGGAVPPLAPHRSWAHSLLGFVAGGMAVATGTDQTHQGRPSPCIVLHRGAAYRRRPAAPGGSGAAYRRRRRAAAAAPSQVWHGVVVQRPALPAGQLMKARCLTTAECSHHMGGGYSVRRRKMHWRRRSARTGGQERG